MKLAEALQYRSDLQNRIEELRKRLTVNANYQEGEKPLEDVAALRRDLDGSIEQLEDLIFRINDTNNNTMTSRGSLTKVLATRETLKIKRSVLASLAEAASDITPRYGRYEIKVFTSVDVKSLRKEMDELAKELREIELLVQQMNWLTELV